MRKENKRWSLGGGLSFPLCVPGVVMLVTDVGSPVQEQEVVIEIVGACRSFGHCLGIPSKF
jgi:hypothetical protein